LDADYLGLSDDSRDENQLERIVAAEAACLKLRADLIASLRNGNYQSREESAPSENYHGVVGTRSRGRRVSDGGGQFPWGLLVSISLNQQAIPALTGK
jgi:hypothetical protein